MFKWLAVLFGALLAVAVLVLLAVTWIESRQSRQLAGKQPYAPPATASRAAVVYFSRSGNTALAARHVARRLDAQLFALEAPDYLNRPDNRGGYLVKVKYPSMSYYPGFVGSFLQPELEEYTR